MIAILALLMISGALNPADAVWPSEPPVPELRFETIQQTEPQFETPEEALLAYQTARNDAIASGDEEALWTLLAAHLHPVGEWDADLIKCFSEAVGGTFDEYTAAFFEPDTLFATDGWTPVEGPHPGAGTAPESTFAVVRNTGIFPQQRHVAFTDDMHLITFYEAADPPPDTCF